MQPSGACYSIIKQFEGLQLMAYADPATKAEPYTIGWGTTIYPEGIRVNLGDVITKERAEQCLIFEVDKKAVGVNDLTKNSSINQHQFDAVTSLSYNIGLGNFKKSSVLKKLLIDPNDTTIKDSFLLWNKAAGKVMAGLTRRREAEYELYAS